MPARKFTHPTPDEQGVYDVTRWEAYLWERRADAPVVADAVRKLDDAAVKHIENVDHVQQAEAFGGEVFARMYGNPERRENAPAGTWATAHDMLTAMPEFDVLREAVAGDPDIAALAVAQVLPAVADKLAAIEREAERKAEGRPSDDKDGAAIRSALRGGIARATAAAEQARDALCGLAPGMESAPPTHEQADRRRLDLAVALASSPNVREVLRRAGRIERLMRDTRKTADPHARSEVVDLERGADLSRVLPSQLGRLTHPTLRKLALRDVLTRSCVQYKLGGTEHLGRGPIVVMLDRSGSMGGSPEQWASAAAIALVSAGVRERRTVTVVEFTYTTDTITRVAKARGTHLAISGGTVQILGDAGDHAAVAMQLASRRSGGGTSFGPVLRDSLTLGVLDDRADLVIVTDGQAEQVDADTIAKLTEAKTRGLRLFALTVNRGSVSTALKQIADAVVDLDAEPDVAAAIAKAAPTA